MNTGYYYKGLPVLANIRHDRVFLSIFAKPAKKGKPVSLRPFFRSEKSCLKPFARGGKTYVILYTEWEGKREILARGEATCSMSDTFCYKKGRELAYERAIQAYRLEYVTKFIPCGSMVVV